MIKFVHKGNFKKTEKFLKKMSKMEFMSILNEYGARGVEALKSATPLDSGKTASMWSYEIQNGSGEISIIWSNSNVNKNVNIAVILQYGHGTRNGGYVVGRDYINPAIQPVFDEISEKIWKEVVSS